MMSVARAVTFSFKVTYFQDNAISECCLFWSQKQRAEFTGHTLGATC